ncbi:hypothetical protein Ccrd_019041 [Cynara cardunculus var. scolymus]|uniref:Encoded peptide n=1 Tax=Cynara cardunculus var. scolymus TaxID=59895 RepID=A0A124SFA7_CYNCS|nr:hypothetical protein Ccrd_019041 [Cynara cardunculus var. scolymus]
MASFSRTLLVSVLIVLFMTNEVAQTSEARKLAEKLVMTEENGATNPSQVPPPPSGVDAFRPTTPGHSPGVGHSVHN